MSSLNKNNVLSDALNWDGELLADIQNALKEKLREMDTNANGGVSSVSLSVNGSNQLVVEITRADGTKRAASYDVSNMIGGGGSVVMGRIVDGMFYPATRIEGGNAYADTPLANPDTGKLYIDMPHGDIYRYNPNLSDPWERMSKIAVDGTLSSTSNNPISNKAVTLALSNKLEARDIVGKADKLAGMLTPAQWPKVVILNVGNTIFQAQTGDVFFDAGILYLQTSSTENTPIGAPQEGTLYYCLADNHTYYWRGNSWHQAGGSGNGTVQSVSVNNGTPAQPDPSTGNVNLTVEAGAQGPKGDTGNVQVDGNGNVLIVNNLEDGGTGAAFSAEMGKRVAGREATDRQRIDEIVAILKKAVFTEGVSFATLDSLANGIDSISFNASSHKFTNLGDTFTLSVVTDPAGKTAQIQSWTSTNASVATVNNGVVTAVADGDATITATTTDGKVAVCKIEVETIVITGLTLSTNTLTLNGNGAAGNLVATTVPAGHESGVQWTSSDPTVATVNNGVVTAVANGQTTITASIGGQTATCQVTVTGVKQKFQVSLGTLSNVTVEDGDGNAIANGKEVLEDSSLTIVLKPYASHEITTASVTMGDVAQTLTDNQDGSKSVTLTVSGDIAVSASASFVEFDYAKAADVADIDSLGVWGNGNLETYGTLHLKSIPLDFGKFYILSGYDVTGLSNGYAFGLYKKTGSGEKDYAGIVIGTDTNKVYSTAEAAACSFYGYTTNDSKLVLTADGNKTYFFAVPPQSDFAQGIDKVYLLINTKTNNNDDVSNIDISVKEFSVQGDLVTDYGFGFDQGYLKRFGSTRKTKLFELEAGADYSYTGYVAQSDTAGMYCLALVAVIDGFFRSLTKAEVPDAPSFFNQGTYLTRMVGPQTGSFTAPSTPANVWFAAVLQYTGYSETRITLTKD